jgi:hypothetical protein
MDREVTAVAGQFVAISIFCHQQEDEYDLGNVGVAAELDYLHG